MNSIKALIGGIRGIHSEPLVLPDSFPDLVARFAHLPGTVALMSGGDFDSARYHILGIHPWLILSGRERRMTLRSGETLLQVTSDPFDMLREILSALRLDENPGLTPPLRAGLLGYISYDLKDSLERLPRTSVDDLLLPHIYFTAPSVIVVHDLRAETTQLFAPRRTGTSLPDAEAVVADFRRTLNAPAPSLPPFAGDTGGFRSNFTRPLYMDAIRTIREYIAAGHVYQVNLSQRFQTGFSGDPFHLFRTLFRLNPAPFFAFIQAGDHQIISTSPERFLLQEGRDVETRPIKGTRPRGETPETDAARVRDLLESPKDDAELSMIVDLLRNDIGKVCEAGSVRVAEHKRLETYRNVHHLVSRVEGTLEAGRDAVDLLRATFPGGSITGCPKIRSMEIIDELETHRRHIYTGSIGYISFHDTMDLSIAIRTATVTGGRILFSVGGGIVYDSDPADEYEETLHKGRTLMTVFAGETNRESEDAGWVWMNGALKPHSEASVPVAHPGFQYGFGFFETLRVVQSRPSLLEAHTERFNRTWRHLFPGEPPDLSWGEIIRLVIEKNGLSDRTAAVKIIAAKGDREHPPFNHSLIVTARPYTHRLQGRTEAGLRLLTYPFPRHTPLADHKTLNYLYYLRAGAWAREHGGDEALVLNPDGTASETNTANLLLIRGNRVEIPDSDHVLPGIMASAVVEWFSRHGYRIETRRVSPEAFFSADQVLLTNSLMGVVPAIHLDGRPLAAPDGLRERINRELGGGAFSGTH